MLPSVANLSYEQRLKELDLPSLMYRRLQGDLIETFKLTNGFYKVNIDNYLCLNKDTRTRGHCYKLAKQSCNLEVRKHFFSLRVVDTWNSLPQSTVTVSSINSFKYQIDKLLKRLV